MMDATTTGITDTQSYALVIRDMFYDKLVGAPFFAGFTVRKQKQMQVRFDMIPFLGVYIVDETMTPDGDINAGDIRFMHHVRIGMSVVIQNNDPDASEKKLDQAFWSIMHTLWPDQYMMSLGDTVNPHTGIGNPDGTRIEGIERGTRKHNWGNAGLNNELPIAELQYEVTVRFRTAWPPTITDDLETIHITSMPIATKYPDDPDAIEKVELEWDMTAVEPYPPAK